MRNQRDGPCPMGAGKSLPKVVCCQVESSKLGAGVGGVVARVYAPTILLGDEDLGLGLGLRLGLGTCGDDDHCQGNEDQENVSQGCSTIEFEREPLRDAAWILQFSAES